jgi:PAS domain S-box-containing protein
MGTFPVPFKVVVIVLATAFLVLVGVLNLRDRARWLDPTDGVYWVENDQGLMAAEVEPDGPGFLAGIRAGDYLKGMDGHAIATLGQYSDLLYDGIGINGVATYTVSEGTETRDLTLRIAGKRFLQPSDFLRSLLAFAHLFIGLYVIIRGIQQPRAFHFFVICLTSFVVYLYSFTPALRTLDFVVYGLSIAAFLLLPALFVHFCLRFPLDLAKGRSRAPLIYLPALLLGLAEAFWFAGRLAGIGLPRTAASQAILERTHLVYFCLGFLAGGAILMSRRKLARDFITRQQMKWVSYGTLAGIVPFSLIYGLPWLLGARANFTMLSSQLFLGLIPLSFAYAIVRYRLIDVEVIMRRGAAYFLASLLLLALYVFFVLVVGKALEWAAPEADFLAISLAALTIALLFAPLRHAIQLRLDRYFYKEQFNDRASLLEFARTLSTEISLERVSRNVLERVRHTFQADKAALFLADPAHPGCYRIADGVGMDALLKIAPVLREEELYERAADAGPPMAGHLRRAHPVLQKDGLLYLQDLYVRGRRIGIIGLGSLRPGRHFSSEDLDLLQALAGYAAIALDNANLYRSIETKALELERLRKYTENIIESINIAVLALDLEGRATSCNRAFEMLYGIQREQLRGADVDRIISADVIASIHNATGRQDWNHSSVTNIYKLFLENRRGERLIVNLGVIPLLDPKAQNSGCLIVMDDISSKVRLEEQLLQVEKLSSIGLLAAGLAHEVNTPITGISSYTQMLLKGMPDSDDRKPILQKIEKQTFRAAEIVNGLLNFARMNGTDFTDVDINRLIRESLNLLDHQFRHCHIQVEPQLDHAVPPVYGNAGKLQQVFVNLFLNAKDAMPHGGLLRIQTQQNDSTVEVDIADSGVGISEENLKRIFDPFYTTKRSGKGTGLGLAITYGIVQEHGGRIFVESTPQKGTHFRLKLPTREAVRV